MCGRETRYSQSSCHAHGRRRYADCESIAFKFAEFLAIPVLKWSIARHSWEPIRQELCIQFQFRRCLGCLPSNHDKRYWTLNGPEF
jgi:hypothetical protein